VKRFFIIKRDTVQLRRVIPLRITRKDLAKSSSTGGIDLDGKVA
jgi:hypothetical protein